MKKEKYFSVQEFAKMVGVSRQTVYNSKRLKPYIKVINGHKWVDKEALRFYEKNNSDKEENVKFYTEKCGFDIEDTEKDGSVRLYRFLKCRNM